MEKKIMIPCVVVLLGLAGCEEFQQPKPAKTKIVKENRVPVRRFILTKNDADVAFDTQTGLGEFSPTCISLYNQYPSGVSTATEALPDE